MISRHIFSFSPTIVLNGTRVARVLRILMIEGFIICSEDLFLVQTDSPGFDHELEKYLLRGGYTELYLQFERSLRFRLSLELCLGLRTPSLPCLHAGFFDLY